jgi:XTP/dITP diphosphohydrolase
MIMPQITPPLLIATHNNGKLREIEEILKPFEFPVVSASGKKLPEPEETGESFEENALLKARHAADHTGMWALADDSGLSVKDLNGAPGIYSARWAGPEKDFTYAMQRIHDELAKRHSVPQGSEAEFVCVLALAGPEGEQFVYTGIVEGRLQFPPLGEQGFGYDPIFIPQGHAETFGQMEPAFKHSISHRAKAFEQLAADLRNRPVA